LGKDERRLAKWQDNSGVTSAMAIVQQLSQTDQPFFFGLCHPKISTETTVESPGHLNLGKSNSRAGGGKARNAEYTW
jgi:hypothetical protein